MKVRFLASILLLASSLVFQGCSTTETATDAAHGKAAPEPDKFVEAYLALEEGLAPEAVVERLGEPDRIEPFVVEGIRSEIWHYNRVVDIIVRSVTKQMIEEPYWDLATNRLAVRKVGVEGTERMEVRADVQLLFYEGKLVSWKDTIEREQHDY